MTEAEALKMSARVVAQFWPNWWTWGQICPGHEQLKYLHPDNWQIADLVCSHGMKGSHEVPPPNLLEPANFVRALTLSKLGVVHTKMGWCVLEPSGSSAICHVVCAKDTPAEALLLALDALRQQEV